METRTIFLNLSPLDHRYSLSEAAVFDKLSAVISEQAAIVSCARAEIALVKAHLSVRGSLTPAIEAELDQVACTIDPSRVYAEE
jgi:adenylosuccinate lyase